MKKVYIVTGASGSVGSVAVREIAARGYTVIMACRNLVKGEAVRQSVLQQCPAAELLLMELKLDSFASVAAFAQKVKDLRSEYELCGLFNNAGIINRDYKLTADGFENTLQVNFLSPFLLNCLLVDSIVDGGNIVNMVSLTCRFGKVGKDIFERPEKAFSQLGTYSDTKLALLLSSIALGRKLAGRVRVNVSDPGVVNSNMISMGRWFDPLADIFFRPFISSPEKGAAPALRAAFSQENLYYFVGNSDRPIKDRYLEHPLLDWLWDNSCRHLSEHCPQLPLQSF